MLCVRSVERSSVYAAIKFRGEERLSSTSTHDAKYDTVEVARKRLMQRLCTP